MRLEEDFGPEEDNESYEGTVRRRRHLAKIFGEHRSVYRMAMHLPLHLDPTFVKMATSRIPDLSLPDETHVIPSRGIIQLP